MSLLTEPKRIPRESGYKHCAANGAEETRNIRTPGSPLTRALLASLPARRIFPDEECGQGSQLHRRPADRDD